MKENPMSFTQVEQRSARLSRSELAVPGSNLRFIEKAAKSTADVVFLDLEDAVAPADKERARKNVIQALNEIDWNGRVMSVRINGLDTQYMYRDVIEVVEQAGAKLDLLLVPKVGTASDVYALDMLLSQIEAAKGFKRRIGLELMIETALGMQNVAEIAAASKRAESLHFGVADFAASIRARTTRIGAPHPDYHVLADRDGDGHRAVHWNDMWHYALSRLVITARAHGLRPIDGPYGDFTDTEGFAACARRSAALGFEGKLVIHPNQVEPANQIFSPSPAEVVQARRVLAAMVQAERDGAGAVALDGRMLDIASIKQAEVLVKKAEAIECGRN
ncbi:L-malyl-CoA/beta-methylmalyl-CoA lyase [uncultured Gammaproteobacteria bacterium]